MCDAQAGTTQDERTLIVCENRRLHCRIALFVIKIIKLICRPYIFIIHFFFLYER